MICLLMRDYVITDVVYLFTNYVMYCILELLQATVCIFILYVVCIFWKLYLLYGEGL